MKSKAQIMFEQYISRCNGMNWSWGWERASAQERNRWRNYAKSVMREIKHQEAQQTKDTHK